VAASATSALGFARIARMLDLERIVVLYERPQGIVLETQRGLPFAARQGVAWYASGKEAVGLGRVTPSLS
jgi:hypothetical protein